MATHDLLEAGLPELVQPEHVSRMDEWAARANGLSEKLFYFLDKAKETYAPTEKDRINQRAVNMANDAMQKKTGRRPYCRPAKLL
jgi:hypothetical protein